MVLKNYRIGILLFLLLAAVQSLAITDGRFPFTNFQLPYSDLPLQIAEHPSNTKSAIGHRPSAMPQRTTLDLSLDRFRVQRDETVSISIQALKDGKPSGESVQAVVLTPGQGTKQLLLTPVSNHPGLFHGQVSLPGKSPEGLYVVHAWTGDSSNPTAIAKGSFLFGQLINDFLIVPYLNAARPETDLDAYLEEFKLLGGNLLVAHNLISLTKAYFPSTISKTEVVRGSASDLVELVLSRADRAGIAVLLSVSWDMTRQSPYQKRMEEIKAISRELHQLYKHHPSLAGFYSYQEGSGTYFVDYVREFSGHIKSLDRNLLTACAPHVDDPLLAGYLSTVEALDIIIYQAGVMASYRTDNRKKYPIRRVKDFCALGAGAKRLQNKIAINHVELFGYLEKRLNPQTTATTYENIYPQILSAATVTGADGISFFTYHAHIYETKKKLPAVDQNSSAVIDGMKAFRLITSEISFKPNQLAFYFPYSDWIIERWHNYFLPALDAFRILGVPVDVLPYAPPLSESVYPYYPFHMNQDVLARLLKENTILVLPNVSGFQQTDSDLIKAFVEQGGVLVAFGPQIPMGRSYERADLFGIEENEKTAQHREVIVQQAGGKRLEAGSRFSFVNEAPSWTAKDARVLATFEDGSPAVATKKFGKGTTITILVDAWNAAENLSELVRDVLDYALSLKDQAQLVDIVGTTENADIAVTQTATGFRVAIVSYRSSESEVILKPLRVPVGADSVWLDLVTNQKVAAGQTLKVQIPGSSFRALEFRITLGS